MKLLTTSKNVLDSLLKLKIETSEDLLNHIPYRYEDMSYTDESELEDNQKIVILGKLVSTPKHIQKNKVDLITFFFVSEKGTFFLVKLFNRAYYLSQLSLSEKYTIVGTYHKEQKELIVSSIHKGVNDENKKLRGVYRLPNDLSSVVHRNLVERTLDKYYECIIDELPSTFVSKYRLLAKKDALRLIHRPNDFQDVTKGLRTLKYHECLAYCLKNQLIRGENKRIPSLNKGLIIEGPQMNEFIKSLNFKLTVDQKEAIRDIINDMNQKTLMYRLLQGDVGTGKTIVAALALYGNYLRKKVGAFMVPTDSLARQQYRYLIDLFSNTNIKVGLLIGALSQKEKNQIKNDLINGNIDIIVGTHALFSSDVIYPSLGLAIIDEQHRFGVNQRNELISKDESCDLLLMSATPIPRTLALSIYGDLDISSLTCFPSSKREVITKVVNPKNALIFSTIKDCILEDRQVFVVAPRINATSDKLESAEKIYDVYKTLFKDEVRLLHGQMKSEEKSQILDDFSAKKFHILVATSVIELGINILEAGAILIYSSSRFGLASLHQLRGRVGRDGKEAICLLIDENEEDERLKILEKSLDGFYIAEMDMKLRGPGDAFGIAQSGFPTFTCLNIVDDFRMFECARDDAVLILKNQDNDEYKRYRQYVEKEYEIKDITLFD